MKQAKLAIFSANYNTPGPVDPFRRELCENLANDGLDVLLIETNAFIQDLDVRELVPEACAKVLDVLQEFEPDGALFINSAGRVDKVRSFLEKSGIASVTWFWDHPGFNHTELLAPSRRHVVAAANKSFISWYKSTGISQVVEFLPFPFFNCDKKPSLLTAADWQSRKIPMVFMGTLWDPLDFENKIERLCKRLYKMSATVEIFSALEKLLPRIMNGLPMANPKQALLLSEFESCFGSRQNLLNELANYFSSRDRIRLLRELIPDGLWIYGPRSGWQKLLHSMLPEFQQAYRNENVTNAKELNRIMRDSKIGINVFHRQSNDGGTNFRFMECSLSQTPILSTSNKECERVFQHGKAAFYFESAKDAAAIVRDLRRRPSYAARVANQAYEIALKQFNAGRIVNSILRFMNLEIPSGHEGRGSITVLNGMGTSEVRSPQGAGMRQKGLESPKAQRRGRHHLFQRFGKAAQRRIKESKSYYGMISSYEEALFGARRIRISAVAKVVVFLALGLRRSIFKDAAVVVWKTLVGSGGEAPARSLSVSRMKRKEFPRQGHSNSGRKLP